MHIDEGQIGKFKVGDHRGRTEVAPTNLKAPQENQEEENAVTDGDVATVEVFNGEQVIADRG